MKAKKSLLFLTVLIFVFAASVFAQVPADGWYSNVSMDSLGYYENATGMFEAKFKLTVDSVGANGIVWRTGFSDSAASGYGDVGPILAFENDFTIEARNGGSFTADNTVTFAQGDSFDVQMIINVVTNTYTVILEKNSEGLVVLAKDYQFSNASTKISNMYQVIDYSGESWSGDPGIITVSDIEIDDFIDTPLSSLYKYDVAKGIFETKFMVKIDSLGNQGVVWRMGFSEGTAQSWGDVGPILAFNSDNGITARNGSSYTADEFIDYTQGDSLYVMMRVNVVSNTYSVLIAKNDSKCYIPVASDYKFRNASPVLDNMFLYMDSESKYGGDPGILTIESFEFNDFLDLPIVATEAADLNITFTLSVDSLGERGVSWRTGFSDSAASSWGDVGPILAFNTDFSIKARNGGSYTADTVATYATGDTIDVEMNINVPANTYSINLTINDTISIALATDYAFRNPATVLDNMYFNLDAESKYGGDPGIITISNIEGVVFNYCSNVVAVENKKLTQPVSYSLSQNYPNPFNPTTTISYSLKQEGKVTLKVYNLLGKHIATLVDENTGVGSHTVQWDGRNKLGNSVASGVYIYKMEVGDIIKSKKMLMLK